MASNYYTMKAIEKLSRQLYKATEIQDIQHKQLIKKIEEIEKKIEKIPNLYP